MRERAAEAIEAARAKREESGHDYAIFPQTPDRRGFAQADGDVPGKHLTLKQKKSQDSGRMPSIDDAYNSSNTGRYSES